MRQLQISPADLIAQLIEAINYLGYLKDGTPQGEARIENVHELMNQAEDYKQVGLAGFLEEAALLSSSDQASGSVADSVTLMTLHAAKGLEFPVVFMVGMEEEILPHARAVYDQSQGAISEERRLCYVGMTRAREALYLSWASQRQVFGQSRSALPSRFLKDIPTNLIEEVSFEDYSVSLFNQTSDEDLDQSRPSHQFVCGDSVNHEHFGAGTVVIIDGDNLVIDFVTGGQKTINTAFAKLDRQ